MVWSYGNGQNLVSYTKLEPLFNITSKRHVMYEHCRRYPSFIKLNTICCIYTIKILMWHTIHLYKTLHQGIHFYPYITRTDGLHQPGSWILNIHYVSMSKIKDSVEFHAYTLHHVIPWWTPRWKSPLIKFNICTMFTENTITGRTYHVELQLHFHENYRPVKKVYPGTLSSQHS